jgi:hypothetical protein
MKCKDQQAFGLRDGNNMWGYQVALILRPHRVEKDEFFGDTTGRLRVTIFSHAKHLVCNVGMHCYGSFVVSKWCFLVRKISCSNSG